MEVLSAEGTHTPGARSVVRVGDGNYTVGVVEAALSDRAGRFDERRRVLIRVVLRVEPLRVDAARVPIPRDQRIEMRRASDILKHQVRRRRPPDALLDHLVKRGVVVVGARAQLRASTSLTTLIADREAASSNPLPRSSAPSHVAPPASHPNENFLYVDFRRAPSQALS